jgi:mannose-1-phosphate guanylyltransferase
VIPIAFTWSDVGSWAALPEVHALDAEQNCSAGGGRVLAHEARRNIVYGKRGELTALVGVHDLVVVRAGKAVLVCPRDRAQDVKSIVARLEQGDPSFL